MLRARELGAGDVSQALVQRIREALLRAGLEIYQATTEEIRLAERVRLHLMDSGVRVRLGKSLAVVFTARTQQSDFPDEPDAEALLAHVRNAVGAMAGRRGYVEAQSGRVEVKDPMDASRTLDVWHEITYAKEADEGESLVPEVQWALRVEKTISPGSS